MSKPAGEIRPVYGQATLSSGGTAHIIPASVTGTTGTVFIKKIVLSITTHANAKTVTFQDTNGTPVVIAVFNDFTSAAGVPDSPHLEFGDGDDERLIQFGGVSLTVGCGLDVVNASSGPAGIAYVEGYVVKVPPAANTVFSANDTYSPD